MVIVRFLSAGSIVVGLILYAIASSLDLSVLSVVGVLLVLAGPILFLIKHRCPNCRRLLPWRLNFDVTYCPYCGDYLD